MRLATGLRKIVDMYADRIIAATGGWVEWDQPLGCGHFGCVWALANMDPGYNSAETPFQYTGRVLKISVDPTEGPVVAAIMKTGLDKQLDGLARWEGVWRIPSYIGSRAGRDTGWVIIREEVRPLGAMKSMINPLQWDEYLRRYNQHIRRFLDLKGPQRRQEEKSKATDAVRGLFQFEETYYVAQAIDALGLEGITLTDIHVGNLGFRINPTDEQPIMEGERPSLLIFDPGHSSAPEVEVPLLW